MVLRRADGKGKSSLSSRFVNHPAPAPTKQFLLLALRERLDQNEPALETACRFFSLPIAQEVLR
jgi:hypothetical protein